MSDKYEKFYKKVDKYIEENPDIKKYLKYTEFYKKKLEPNYFDYLKSMYTKYIYWYSDNTKDKKPEDTYGVYN